MSTISRLNAREILDSRGNPTIEVDLVTASGLIGRASVPSGASTGANEALELRDGDKGRYGGNGVLKAIKNVREEISAAVIGKSVLDQAALDDLLIKLDGTENKSRLGANAVLGVSMAAAHAAAMMEAVPLYRHFAKESPVTMPVPMFNIFNGGKHAEGSADMQEFMVVPAGFPTFRDAVRAGSEMYQSLKKILKEKRLGTTVGDEGGFAFHVSSNREAMELVLKAIEKAGYTPGKQVFMALDVAATEFWSDGKYNLVRDGKSLTSAEMVDMYEKWVREFPIISIEDGLAEGDWDGWSALMRRIGDRVQGDRDQPRDQGPGRGRVRHPARRGGRL